MESKADVQNARTTAADYGRVVLRVKSHVYDHSGCQPKDRVSKRQRHNLSRDGLLDDLVGGAEQRLADRKARRLGAVHVDDLQDLAVNTRNRYFAKQVPSGHGGA